MELGVSKDITSKWQTYSFLSNKISLKHYIKRYNRQHELWKSIIRLRSAGTGGKLVLLGARSIQPKFRPVWLGKVIQASKRVPMGLTDRRKTAKNLVDSRKIEKF